MLKKIKSIFILFMGMSTSFYAQQPERIVLISTNKGDMKVKLYNDTPRHRDYFLELAGKGYFDGTLFGRCIQQFIIQGGSQDSRGAKSYSLIGDGDRTMEIPHEIRPNRVPKYGAVGCPRRDVKDNPDKDSDMSMFFIVEGRPYRLGELDTLELATNIPIKKPIRSKLYAPIKEELDSLKTSNPAEFNKRVRALNQKVDSLTRATPGSLYFSEEEKVAYSTLGGSLHLKNEYTFFGEVIEGLDVIEKISSIPTNGYNRPKEDIVMKVTIIK